MTKTPLRPVTEEVFNAFLKLNRRAIPDGFRIVGGFTQARYLYNGHEVARDSWDSQGHLYEILDTTTP